MKYLTRLKSEKWLCDELAKVSKVKIKAPKELLKPLKVFLRNFDSISGRHFVENVSHSTMPLFCQPGGLVIFFETDSRYSRRAREPTLMETI